MTIRVRIRNLMGVEAADLPLSRIALVGGLNGAGKSSLLEGIACAVVGSHETRGVSTKRGAATLVREGSPAGSATLEWEDGAVRVAWPDAEASSKGAPRFLGTPLGIGATHWMDLSEKKRAAEMAERLRLQPTQEHLAAFLADKDVKAETVAAVWRLIEDQGWDAAHKKAQEQATKLRGRWEQVAGEAFGSKKAEGWRPMILDDAEIYTEEAATDAVKAAKVTVERLLVAGAISDEQISRARAEAADLGPAKAREQAARQKIAELDATIEKAQADLAKIGPTDQAVHTYPCPHCQRPVWLKRDRATEPFHLVKPPAPLTEAEVEQRRLARQALEHAIAKSQAELKAATATAQEAVGKVRAAEAATTRLAELEAMPRTNSAELAEARQAQAKAEAVLDAVRAWEQAKAIFADWQRSQPIIEALAPTGVRAKRVAEAIAAFNDRLAQISARAGFGTVALDASTDATLNGRAFSLLSESERWRVNLVLTLALAQMEQAAVVLVDRLDVLHPQARPGVFMALHEVGIPAVVGCTAKDSAQLPPLHKAKVPGTDEVFGATYWLEGGRLAPVE